MKQTPKDSTQTCYTILPLEDTTHRLRLSISPWVGINFTIDGVLSYKNTHCILKDDYLYKVGVLEKLTPLLEELNGKQS